MPNADWLRVKEAFNRALDLPPESRPSYLARIRAEDPELGREVGSLLSQDSRPASLFAGPAFEVAAELIASDAQEDWRGRRIGAHRLLHCLGRGGMGTVYLAERADKHFQKQVAIKLIRRGMDSESIVRRFRQEQQILAHLEHPNIARLLDGGVTQDGLSYFVMDYVCGKPITTYCADRNVGVEERLDLFRQVCAAVGYAHRNLVVHCDLKPSNILVTEEGVPKLLDFGVAKILAADPGGDMAVGEGATFASGGRLMTPEYASPEQILGETITTVSDIYSLGMLLYELLAGRLPYKLRGRSRAEIERAIREVRPRRPSLIRSGDSGQGYRKSDPIESRASNRGTGEKQTHEPGSGGGENRSDETSTTRLDLADSLSSGRAQRVRWGRRFGTDLDNIALMALRKDPSRRYSSAEQLSEDIRRHLVGLPVLAAPDRLGYRVGKLLRRHRVAAAASLLVFLSLVAGILVATWQARRATLAGGRADQTLDFMLNLISQADPHQSGRADLSLKETLDRSLERIDRELGDRPGVRAAVLDTLGRAYSSHGDHTRGESLLQEALSLRLEAFGEGHLETTKSRISLGLLSNDRHHYAEAGPWLRQALRGLGKKGHPRLRIEALLGLARAQREQGEWQLAEPMYWQALELGSEAFGEDSVWVSDALNGLALVHRNKGDHEAAEGWIRRSLELRRTLFGEEHPKTLDSQLNLGGILQESQQLEHSETVLRRVLELQPAVLGPEHPQVLEAKTILGVTLRRLGRVEEAEKSYGEAMVLARKLASPGLPLIQQNLAVLHHARGQYAEAESLLREALATQRARLGEKHVTVMQLLYSLGLARRAQGDLEAAVDLHRQALAIGEEVLPEENWQRGRALVGLAQALVEMGNWQEATPLARQGLASLASTFAPDYYRIGHARSVLGQCLSEAGAWEEAEGELLAGQAILESASESVDSLRLDAERRLRDLRHQRGES